MPKTIRFLLFVCASTVLLVAVPAYAQAGPATGSRVRVAAPELGSERLVATVAASTRDSLLLSFGDGAAELRLDKATIERLEVSRGRARLQWTLIGAGAGFLGGAVIGAAIGGHNDTSGWGGLVGMIGGASLGLPTGAVGGALLAPERWATYHLPRRTD